jgi:hypothetical protein
LIVCHQSALENPVPAHAINLFPQQQQQQQQQQR